MKARQPLQQETATPSSDDRYLAVTHEAVSYTHLTLPTKA